MDARHVRLIFLIAGVFIGGAIGHFLGLALGMASFREGLLRTSIDGIGTLLGAGGGGGFGVWYARRLLARHWPAIDPPIGPPIDPPLHRDRSA
jgi:hypothetical protein